MKCSRTACQKELTGKRYHIYNQPSTVKGYREYCVGCGRRIMSVPHNQVMKSEVVDPEGEGENGTINI